MVVEVLDLEPVYLRCVERDDTGGRHRWYQTNGFDACLDIPQTFPTLPQRFPMFSEAYDITRYAVVRCFGWFRHGEDIFNRIFKGYNFLKNFFYFQNFFQKKESRKNIFFIFANLQKSREDKTILDDGDFAQVWPRTAIHEMRPKDDIDGIRHMGLMLVQTWFAFHGYMGQKF